MGLFIYLFIIAAYWLTCIHAIYVYVFLQTCSSGFWFNKASLFVFILFLSKISIFFCILNFDISGDNVRCDNLYKTSCFTLYMYLQ